jgi:hypothetical protein
VSAIHQAIAGIRQVTLEGLLKQEPGVCGQETEVIPHPLREGMGLSVHPVHHSECGSKP